MLKQHASSITADFSTNSLQTWLSHHQTRVAKGLRAIFGFFVSIT
jgi:hypothetical protein